MDKKQALSEEDLSKVSGGRLIDIDNPDDVTCPFCQKQIPFRSYMTHREECSSNPNNK